MLTFLVGIMLAVNLGPIGPDSPAGEPQMAVNGSMVALVFGAGKGIASTSARPPTRDGPFPPRP